MGKYNFDRYIERRGTDSSKWDGFESRFPGYNASGALPMWVADMDFTAPDEVIDVLKKKAAFGIYGYPAPKGKSFDDAFIRWVKKRHDLNMMAESLVIGEKPILSREEVLMYAAAMAYAGNEEFPFEVELGDETVETETAEISGARIRRKSK